MLGDRLLRIGPRFVGDGIIVILISESKSVSKGLGIYERCTNRRESVHMSFSWHVFWDSLDCSEAYVQPFYLFM